MGGAEFGSSAAIIPIMIMAFYPMHQTYGQLSNVLFFATDQTRLFADITMVSMVIGVPFTYFLLASPQHYGLAAGAIGLAVKMVLFNIVTNNVLLWFNARFLNLPFGWYVRHQIVTFVVFLLIAAGVTFVSDHWIMPGAQVFLKFVVSGVFYFLVAGAVVFLFPDILGISRQKMLSLLNRR
jgi:ethanolamine transporter EutH